MYPLRGDGSGKGRISDGRDEPGGEVVAVWSAPGDIGRRYAEVTGDRNIHLHGPAQLAEP